eukprot:6423708-Amphidinium_carterae.1
MQWSPRLAGTDQASTYGVTRTSLLNAMTCEGFDSIGKHVLMTGIAVSMDMPCYEERTMRRYRHVHCTTMAL